MTTTKSALALALALLAATPAAALGGNPIDAPDAADAAPDAFPRGPEELLLSLDPDGGRTLRLLLEDASEGEYTYTRVDLSNAHETAADRAAAVNGAVAQMLRDTNEPIREAGAFAHTWTRGASPMTTVGVYAVHETQGLLRAPLVILENVTGTSGLVALAQAFATAEAADLASSAVPLLLEYAVPEFSDELATWPPGESAIDSFRDYPRVYAWTVRKASPAGEVWEGAYLERLGWREGGVAASQRFEGAKSVEVGLAVRVADETTRVAGAFVESHLVKEPGDTRLTRHRVTVGAAGDATGRVPLAGVDAADERTGPATFTYPAHQRTGVALGAYVAGEWTPLLGTRTEATHVEGANGDVEQTRVTSVGAYALGEFVPLAGVRYHGDRSATLDWATRFVGGGGPGATTMGDWELDVGAFVAGEFTPLAGATYADTFPNGLHEHQTMVTAGVHSPLGYQPVVGVTYDGERPLIDWALAWSEGDRKDSPDWMVSAGAFAGADYVPVLGARYDNRVAGATREYQERYTVGAFLGSYRAFVPLAGVTYDGEDQHLDWAQSFATGGTLGADVGDWDAAAGAYALGRFAPLLEVRYRNAYGDGWASQSVVTVGARAPTGEFVPLAGVTYSSSEPLVGSLNAPTAPGDDSRAFVTAGVFVLGEYVPLVMVTNDGDHASVGLLPPEY